MVLAYIASFVQNAVSGLGSSSSYRLFMGVALFCILAGLYLNYYLFNKVTELEKGQIILLGAAVRAQKRMKAKRRSTKPNGSSKPPLAPGRAVPLQALKVCAGTNAAKGHPFLRSTDKNTRSIARTEFRPLSSDGSGELQLKPATMSDQARKSELLAMNALMSSENVCLSSG
eukprot:jgi/Bigna1/129895/aug1.10_g4603